MARLFIFLICFFLAHPCFGAVVHKYVDESATLGGNNGTSKADAWLSITSAFGTNQDTYIWVRRSHTEALAATLSVTGDQEIYTPARVIGWPRAEIPNTTITAADWTNGSRLIDNVIGITPDREQHIGRFAVGPDGYKYLITAILYEAGVDGMAGGDEFTVGANATNTTQTKYGRIYGFVNHEDNTGLIQYARDSSSVWVEDDNIIDDGATGGSAEIEASGESAVGFVISREYPGGTVTGVDGKFSIEKDEDYDLAQTLPDAENWDADNDDLPQIDQTGGIYSIDWSADDSWIIKNIEFIASQDHNFLMGASIQIGISGCLLRTSFNGNIINASADANIIMNRVIAEGSGSGVSQELLKLPSATIYIQDSAFYNAGASAVYLQATQGTTDNVNLGVEICNKSDSIIVHRGGSLLMGSDLEIEGTNGIISWVNVVSDDAAGFFNKITMENYNRSLGDYIQLRPDFSADKTPTSSLSCNTKYSSEVLEINTSGNRANISSSFGRNGDGYKIYEARVIPTASGKDYRIWVFNDTNNTINATTAFDDVWLRCDVVANYDDDSEYVINSVYSTETGILHQGGADDWDYLQCSNVAVDSDVLSTGKGFIRVSLYWSSNLASAAPFIIDPDVQIGDF